MDPSSTKHKPDLKPLDIHHIDERLSEIKDQGADQAEEGQQTSQKSYVDQFLSDMVTKFCKCVEVVAKNITVRVMTREQK